MPQRKPRDYPVIQTRIYTTELEPKTKAKQPPLFQILDRPSIFGSAATIFLQHFPANLSPPGQQPNQERFALKASNTVHHSRPKKAQSSSKQPNTVSNRPKRPLTPVKRSKTPPGRNLAPWPILSKADASLAPPTSPQSPMFRKKTHRAAPDPFGEPFWLYYVEALGRTSLFETGQPLQPYPKKYHHNSHLVTTVLGYFDHIRMPAPPVNAVIAFLKLPFAQGDPVRAFHLARFFQLLLKGLFITNDGIDKANNTVTFVGGENWENVMCYLDALLFLMFANLESFEPMLFVSNQHSLPLVTQLAALLRLHVNLLRSGNLITTDITMKLCEVLAKLGFLEATSHRQQDAASLFEFLAETLCMPLLTFKVDIKHAGKHDKDDQKYSQERILFVSIPDDDVEVGKLDNAAEVTGSAAISGEAAGSANSIENTIHTTEKVPDTFTENEVSGVQSSGAKGGTEPDTPILNPVPEPLKSASGAQNPVSGASGVFPLAQETDLAAPFPIRSDTVSPTNTQAVYGLPERSSSPDSELPEPHTDSILLEECLEHYFNNSISVKRELQRRATMESLRSDRPSGNLPVQDTIPEDGQPLDRLIEERAHLTSRTSRSDSKNTIRLSTRTRSSTLSIWLQDESELRTKPKEVNLPAWMFLRLLPFYTDDNNLDNANQSIANSLKEFVKRRPILPICLKRYLFDTDSLLAHRSKRRIVIPPIMNLPLFVADDVDDDASGDYCLILESAVCHRGTSISLGHFVSAVRKDCKNISQTEDEALKATWYLYDDMKKDKRVVEKLFHDLFDSEWPYMLFYRLVPNGDTAMGSAASSLHNNRISALSSSASLLNVVPPKGSKNKYWEDSLTPIVSGTQSGASEEGISARVSEEGASRYSDSASTVSVPIPAVNPTDSRFVDVRNKYFWYVTDKNMNYHKELQEPVTRRPSLGNFRRNSQWSEQGQPTEDEKANQDTNGDAKGKMDAKSDKTADATPKKPASRTSEDNNEKRPQDLHIRLEDVDYKLNNMSFGLSSKWRLGRKSRSNVASPDAGSPDISAISVEEYVPPVDLREDLTMQKDHKHYKHNKHHKRTKKRRDDYKKEKCVVM